VGESGTDNLADEAIRRLRQQVCIFITIAGLFFAVFLIQTQSTVVGVIGGTSAVLASVLAVSSLVAKRKQHAIERAWLAVGLATSSVALVVVMNVL